MNIIKSISLKIIRLAKTLLALFLLIYVGLHLGTKVYADGCTTQTVNDTPAGCTSESDGDYCGEGCGGNGKCCATDLDKNCTCGCNCGGTTCTDTCDTCTCDTPDAPTWRTGNTVKIRPGTVLQWDNSSYWGKLEATKDHGCKTDCGYDTCSARPEATDGYYKVLANSGGGYVNVTERCFNHTNSGVDATLQIPYCKFDSTDENWRGHNVDFKIRAGNSGCYVDSVTRTFHVDAPPAVDYVTPENGLSGTVRDDDNGLSCSDNNPQVFKVSYSDPDGAGDLAQLGLWIDDEWPHVSNVASSMQGLVRRGSRIRVYMGNFSKGSCLNAGVIAQLEVNGNAVQTYLLPNNGDYKVVGYTVPYVVAAKDVKIRFMNDCYDGPDNDSNLWIDKIEINGKIYEVESDGRCSGSAVYNGPPRGLWAWAQGSVVTCNDSQKYGTSGWSFYGLRYNENDILTCGSEEGPACWRNYSWSIPVGGEHVQNGSDAICAPAQGQYDSTTDSSQDTPCSSVAAGWKVQSVAGVGFWSPTTLEVEYKVWFNQSSLGRNLNVYGLAQDYANVTTSPSWNNHHTANSLDQSDPAPTWHWTLDLDAPIASDITGVTVADKSHVDVGWKVRDSESGLRRMYAVPGLFNSDYSKNTHSVAHGSTSIALPVTDSCSDPDNCFSTVNNTSTKLWAHDYSTGASAWPTDVKSGTERVSIGNIENGDLRFKQYAEDKACNRSSGSGSNNSIGIAYPWLTTKGGLLFNQSGVSIKVKNNTSGGSFDQLGGLFDVKRDEVQVSTEWFGTGGGSVGDIVSNAVNPFQSTGYTDKNASTTFNQLKTILNGRLDNNEVNAATVPIPGNISGSVSDYCSNDLCVLNSANSLNVDDLTCDKGTVIVVNGNLVLNGTVTVGNDAMDGCIFLVKNNITIQNSDNASCGGSPCYDLLQGFFIAGGQINIPEMDQDRDVADGLEVDGSLIGLGTTGNPSIYFQRSLRLMDNMTEPTVVIHHDPRYVFLAGQFFAESEDYYRKDEGFKPF